MDLKFPLDMFKAEGPLKQIFLGCINCASLFCLLPDWNVFKRYAASIVAGTLGQLAVFFAIGAIELWLNRDEEVINLFATLGYIVMPLGLLISFPDYFPQTVVCIPRAVGALIIAWGAVLLTHDTHQSRQKVISR